MAHLAQTRDVHNSIVVDLQIQSIPLGLCRSMDKVLWGLSSLPAIAPLASEGGSEANGATNMFSTPGNSTRSPYTRCSAFIMILDEERGVESASQPPVVRPRKERRASSCSFVFPITNVTSTRLPVSFKAVSTSVAYAIRSTDRLSRLLAIEKTASETSAAGC